MEPTATRPCRVAVVGGGPAGCATALALARQGVEDVVVVEAGDHSGVRVGESLPPDSRPLLDELGVLEPFLAAGHAPCYGSSSSWGSDGLGHNDFLFNPLGHGWHLDRGAFDRFLAARTREAGATLLTHTRLRGAHRDGGGVELDLEERSPEGGGRRWRLEAAFAVDATGHRALLARSLGAEKRYLDRLICANGFFLLPDPELLQHVTLLEAVEYGWWYAARLPGGRVAVAVASDPALLKGRGLSEPEPWLHALAATRHVAPALRHAGYEPGSLRAWPAHSFHLDRPVGEGWLAVGDAAAAFDPISARGVHKALATGVAAGAAIRRHLDGEATALEGYAGRLDRDFRDYAEERRWFYGRETRWPEAPFWSRRSGRA